MAEPAATLVPESEVEVTAVRSRGAGGQNVNKVATAIHLRFDIRNSSLPDDVKERLLGLADRRITRDGVLVIKAQSQRTQELNRAEAWGRLQELVESVATAPKSRRPTRPTAASRRRRLENKSLRSQVKLLRRPVSE